MDLGIRAHGSHAASQDRKLQDYIAIINRGRWIILGALGVGMLLAFIINKVVDPVYRASAQVLINTREMQSTIFLDAARPDGMKNITQNELQMLNSTTLADTVAARLLAVRYADKENKRLLPIIQYGKGDQFPDSVATLREISGRLSADVDFDPVRESDVITISAKSKDPVEASIMANTYAEAYRDRNIYLSRTKTRSFREFLDEQAGEKRKELNQTEQTLQAFMEKKGIVSLDEESKNVIEKLSQLEANRDATNIQVQELSKELASYEEQLPQQETNAARVMGEANDPYIKLLQEQIAKLEVQRDVTVAQNPSSMGRDILNEKVKEIDLQIQALTQKLQKRTDAFLRNLTPSQGGQGMDATSYLQNIKQKIVETQVQLQALQAKKRALDDVIRQYEGQFDRIPQTSMELARLQRTRQSDEKLFLVLQEKYNEANITEQSNLGYIEIIEPASVPFRPSSPKQLVNLMLGAIFGLAIGFGFVFVKEYTDVRVQTVDDLKRRNMKVIATVASMGSSVQNFDAMAKGKGEKKGLDPHIVMHYYPFSPVAESYRQLRTNLQFAHETNAPKVLMVSSPMPGEGKSTTVANLAIAFAQSGRKVLLIDADLRKPTADTLFGTRREPGLSDVLSGASVIQAAVQSTVVENLSLLPCGVIPPNPSEILGSEKMRQLIAEFKEKYDIVLLDSSPVLAVTDPAILATLADAVILVVSAGASRVQNLEHAYEILTNVGGQLIGVVLNNLDLRHSYGFGYRSTYAQRYGHQTPLYAKKGSTVDSEKPGGNGKGK
ncbi:MAG TPA: polysaccharide biosynthesis tyrosine autokinase [Bacteroidota bacterium]|nr:polysaccharide biosynthesis tyrosine autokinase [Bacteroidota bacterium]